MTDRRTGAVNQGLTAPGQNGKEMKLICVSNEHEMSLEASRLIGALVRIKPDAILGLATGSTPLGTYGELSRMFLEENLDFSCIRTINLDEYIGLDGSHPQSYRAFMAGYLFGRINIPPANTFVPDGMAEDIEGECRKFDELMEQMGRVDLQLLGIGANGHIGFNEPADCFTSNFHCTELTEDTIEANSRFFDRREDVPTHAITMGMRGIMNARRLLILASGKKKANAVAEACFGPVTPRVPGSIIQLHPDVTVIADWEALSDTGLFEEAE